MSKEFYPDCDAAPTRPRQRLGCDQDHLALSWLVAITASFLVVGVAGIFERGDFMPHMLAGTKGQGQQETEAMQAVMIDLQTETTETETATEETTEVIEVPPPVEIMEQPQDLPELAEALVTDDVFVIPTPPRIETALRPVDPTPPKPQVRPAAPPAPRRAVAATSPRRTSGSSAKSGGSGGQASRGSASTRGLFVIPKPPYPSNLRALGVQGTVRLSITVGTSGRAENVSIVASSGNSDLDRYAASWARRNGRGPPGPAYNAVSTQSFVLR